MTNSKLTNILNELHDTTADIVASAIISVDGITLAWKLRRGASPDRVGGMSAATLALGNRAARELECGTLKQVVIDGDHGFTVIVQATDDSVLLVTASEGAKLGLILVNTRNAVKQIKQVM